MGSKCGAFFPKHARQPGAGLGVADTRNRYNFRIGRCDLHFVGAGFQNVLDIPIFISEPRVCAVAAGSTVCIGMGFAHVKMLGKAVLNYLSFSARCIAIAMSRK